MGIKTRNPISARRLEQRLLEARGKAFRDACTNAKDQILDRTTVEGKDYSGKPFKKYSDLYAAKRAKEKRRVSPPDLTITGQMMQGLDVQFQDLGDGREVAEFYFKNGTGGYARFVNEVREFFRLSREQLTEIKNRIRKATR